MDNEVSDAYKQAIIDMQMEYQLITPHVHRANIAEKAIQTFKGHFISIMAGVDDSFPLHLWTLNMLRPSNVSPKISAYMYANGNHDYNAHPFAPLGCKVLIHETPDNRHTWDTHALDGWYIGTSMEHYRNQIVWCKDTRAERISDTVWFKHKYLTNPELTAADAIADAAHKLSKTLEANPPSQMPSTNKDALAKLADIFTQAAKQYSDKEARKSASLPGVESQRNLNKEAASPGVRRRSGARTNEDPAPGVPRRRSTRLNTRQTPGVPRREEARSSNRAPVSENTRHRATRREVRSVTNEAILSAIEISAVPIRTQRLAQRQYPLQLLCELAGAVLDPTTGDLLEYRHLLAHPKYAKTWSRAGTKELGRLAQGIPGVVEGTNTIFFKSYDEIPNDRKKDVTYARICVNERPEKEDPNRVRITVGGDRINYTFDVGTPTADMLLVKLLFNSIISTKGAKFMSLDIKNFYLETPMERYEYMRMKISDIPHRM